MSQTVVERNEISNIERLDLYRVTVSLVVKAKSEQDAKNLAAIELNQWFTRTKGTPPYPRNTLMYWRYIEDKELV